MAIMIPRGQLKNKITTLQGKIVGGTATSPNAQNRLNRLQNRYQKRFGNPVAFKNTKVGTDPVGDPIVEQGVGSQGDSLHTLPGSSSTNTPSTSPSQQGLTFNPSLAFPTTRQFEPQDYQGSPLYQFQLQEGQKQLAKSLASRGLSNSGYGIDQELNIPLRVAAQDTDRMTRLASENADRYRAYQEAEANRLERQGNEQFNRQFSLAELLSRQSPWNEAYSGLGNYADLAREKGKSQADYIGDAYKRIIASGGGGGGAYVPPYIAPPPSSPNYINILPAQAFAGASTDKGYGGIVSNLFSSLFK